ncbi:MAG: DNA polymerase I [Rickettsiales bacterium]|nr:DNA polymerase I [Rickettsiales bacterium]
MTKKIALIDGYGFVFRAFHSLPPLTRPDGTPVGAVYGFTNMLIKLLAQLHVTHAAVVFDSGSKTFRNEIYPAYKANRPPCPEELIPQFPIVRESAESLNLAILEKTGFEADDIIATITKKAELEGFEVLIVSSDKDLMQLVNESTFMYDSMKNRFIGIAEVKEKFFVEPLQVLDILSLMGDSSDNIPGVRGIGPKTAAELINEFGTLENIFLNLDKIKQDKRRELLREGEEKAKLSKVLAALKEDVELGISLDDLKIQSLEPHKLISFLEHQGFRSLVTRVKKEFGIADVVVNTSQNHSIEVSHPPLAAERPAQSFSQLKLTEISSQETIARLNKEASQNSIATIDFNQNFFTISTNKPDESPTEIFYFEAELSKKPTPSHQTLDLFSFNEAASQMPKTQGFGLEILKTILEDDSIKKVFFDAKSFLKIAPTNSFEDVSLINHLLTSSTKNDLRELINFNLNENIEELGFAKFFAELDKNREPDFSVEPQKKAEFFAFRNFAIAQLYKIFAPKIFSEKLSQAYNSYEKPLLQILAQIETDGIKIDVEKLRQLSLEFGKKIADLSTEIYALAGQEFNIASPKQLGEILFEKLGLDSSKKSKKTGALSTGVGVLEELEELGHPIARKILDFRKFSKLKNTYTDALPKEINPETARVHTHFSTTSTITGRLSSSHPNLQNIPIKSLEGQKIRESFICEKDHFLISADYSQIELRVIAHVAKIDNLIAAFKDEKDIHRITASQVFGIPENEIDDATRSKAKAINFGIIYGISAFGLARQLDISRQDAAEYIRSYLTAYPGIDAYMKNTIELAREQGFVQTFSGRKCFINQINNKNPIIRNEAERLAINAPIQGSAADVIKKAMIRVSKKFAEEKLRSKMILQIHDELIVEAPKDEFEIATKILKKEMEAAANLDVPLAVDVKIGLNWS